MIEKMQFLSVTGPKKDIDRVVEQYLTKYEIQFENTMSELSATSELRPFLEINPYKDTLLMANELCRNQNMSGMTADDSMKLEDAICVTEELSRETQEYKNTIEELEKEKERLNALLEKILPFEALDIDIHHLLGFKTIRYRFGRIAIDYIEKFEQYINKNVDTIFYECKRDKEYMWGVYFCTKNDTAEVDAIYKSLHFERFRIDDAYQGTPNEAARSIRSKLAEVNKQIEQNRAGITSALNNKKKELFSAQHKLEEYSKNFDIRRLAACTENKNEFYIICFWIAKKDAEKLTAEIDKDQEAYCIVYDDDAKRLSSPPIKLKNPKIFKPFEMYVRMYGLPNYKEIDPTVFVALTYSFIFGWMFGDVGQGLVLVIGGYLLYFTKKINLAAIIGTAGIFSTFFGFMFGSVFGFEDIIEPVWMRPMTQMSELSMIGKLNTVFIIAILFGMGMIIVTMIFHIINAVRQKNLGELVFDTNGIAGLVFYGSLVVSIILLMSGHELPGGALLAVLFIVPLICIGFKEQLTDLCTKHKPEEKTGPVMVVVQALFELIEVLLSYFSNTISFVRIGAFAVSHAAMMEVVLMLAGAESGSPNILVIILGNLFVCGMEGLIVGIQVLRLEYYEMFSRFYKGDGREFKPFNKADNN